MEKQVEAVIPTPWGKFQMQAYALDGNDQMPHLALVAENYDPAYPTLVRIHSECLTGDLFGSKRCDCGEQLERALELAAAEGGIVLYLRQEGRGIGLINKLKAYNLQDQGLNTADANVHLGLEIDDRGYEIAVEILKALEVRSIRLLTNNPDKIKAIEKSGLQLLERVPLLIKPREENIDYLETKKEIMGHLIPPIRK
ncbi:MAG: GTP cyclohydrolase II [Saprospiraceae bacterium]|nr:GTP cyclohydrolase II [Saprospiraceae bacterium]